MKPKVLLIIPAYNEAGNIEKVVKDLKNNANDVDYVIINDASKDNTLEICQKNNYNCINGLVNLGLWGAVQTGLKYAMDKNYDIAIQFDGDGQHDAAYLNEMADYLVKNECDMVIGSRFIEKEGFQSSFIRRVGIKYFTFLIHLLTGKTITDPTSGMRMCNRRTIEMFAKEYPIDYPEPESTVRLIRHKRKIEEVPVIMRERAEGVSSLSSVRHSVYYMIKVSIAILVEKWR